MAKMPEKYQESWRMLSAMVDNMIAVGETKGYGDSVRDICGPEYSEGEIVHKVVRWKNKRDVSDLVKIVGHALMLFHDHGREEDV